jgi:hypothetical protein
MLYRRLMQPNADSVGSFTRPTWKPQAEATSLTGLTCHGQFAADGLCQPFGNRQPQAHTFDSTTAHIFGTAEGDEQIGKIAFFDAVAFILDVYRDSVPRALEPNRDRRFRCAVFTRVVEQDVQYLTQQSGSTCLPLRTWQQ